MGKASATVAGPRKKVKKFFAGIYSS